MPTRRQKMEVIAMNYVGRLAVTAGVIIAAARPCITWGATAQEPPPATAAATRPAGPAATQGNTAAGSLFEGLRALVVEPENAWGWDAAIFGALKARHFDVRFVKAEVLEDLTLLSQCDLVATNIKRTFTAAQAANLKGFVEQGGALYGTWGGPMGTADLAKEVCHVGQTRSVRIAGMRLLDGTPLVKGIADREVAFPRIVGHLAGSSWEIVAVAAAEGGIPVAQDAAGNALGVLGRFGKGRTAVLGFGPEQDKYFVKRELGPAMLDNLLTWLLEGRAESGERTWPGTVEVSLPARADGIAVFLNGEPVAGPPIEEFGSLKKIKVNVQAVAAGKEATLRVTYKPLADGRNVETIIHLPWSSFPRGGPPGKLAEWLRSVHATMCQPLLREGNGFAYYKGMPEDIPDPVSVTGYKGNFLTDFVEECHKRSIKVIGGIYFESVTTLRKNPDAAVVGKDGKRSAKHACFNSPDGQEYNLATIRHLLDNYKVDGVILDDNFELQGYDCCCPFCCDGFKAYCAGKGVPYVEPSRITDAATSRLWHEYKLQATAALAAKVAKIAHDRHVPAGGWVGAGAGGVHLAQSFDFLGGMVYSEPPKAAALSLAVLGKCRFFTLLWAPSAAPDRMEQEVREAVRAGSATVGFWVYPPGHAGGGAFRMLEGSSQAIARSFADVEEEWFRFYRDDLLTGDARFSVLGGKVDKQELTLRIRNTGKLATPRWQGTVDLDALLPSATSLSFCGPSGLKDASEFVAVGEPWKLQFTIRNLRASSLKDVPVRLSLPQDVELVAGKPDSAIDLEGHGAKQIAWTLKKNAEAMSQVGCLVSADPAKPDQREMTVVGKPGRLLEVAPRRADLGTVDPGAKGSLTLAIENKGLTAAEGLAAKATGQAGDWLRVEGLPRSLNAPDWRAGAASTKSFRLAFDIPGSAAPGKYQGEWVITAEGFEPHRLPVAMEVVNLTGLVAGVVRSDNPDWPEYTNDQIYSFLADHAKEEGITVVALRRDDPRLLDKAYLRKIHLLFYGSIREVPQKADALAEALKAYVNDGGWLVADGYGLAWGMMDIRPELRDLVGLKWAHPGSNDVFSSATALKVQARHPLAEGLDPGQKTPMGSANFGGTIYRLAPVLAGLTVPIVLCDSEKEYPYVAIRDSGKGRCIFFTPLMGVFAEQYKTKPAQTIMRNLIRWRKAAAASQPAS
jgi:hypothetical protein